MRKMKPELISSDAGERLTSFLLKHYGTIKNAALCLGVPYLTLHRNCHKPCGGWAYIDMIIGPLIHERDEAIVQRDFVKEQLTHVTRLYNDLVAKLEEANREELI